MIPVKVTVKWIVTFEQVTEQARLSIEARMKEADSQHHLLEEKLHEAEKQKHDLEEQSSKTQASLEDQVVNLKLLSLVIWGVSGI